MEEKRINYINTFVSGRGTGKTTYLKQFIPVYLKLGKKVLIIDTFDHPSYKEVPLIKPTDLARWKKNTPGVKRIVVNPSNIDEDLQHVNQHVSNCLIVFEDCKKYIGTKLSPSLNQIIIDSKQCNNDLFFLYHAWGWISLDILRTSDFIVIGKTQDSPETRKNNLGGAFIQCLDAYKEVQKNESKYFRKTINLQS
jgi:hypothetical protein